MKIVVHIMKQLRSLFAFDKHCMCCPTVDPPAYPGSSHPIVALPVEEEQSDDIHTQENKSYLIKYYCGCNLSNHRQTKLKINCTRLK